MLIKNIIRKSAEFLKLNNVIDYLNDSEESEDVSEIINDFLIAINMVNTNIASSYMELIETTTLSVNKGMRSGFSDISNLSIIEIKSIKTSNGDSVRFKVYPNGIDIDYMGEVVIEYSYFPPDVNLNGNINHYLKLNELTFALGVVGEYLYLQGAYDDATIWDKRFKQNLFNLIRPKRNIVLPQRSFE